MSSPFVRVGLGRAVVACGIVTSDHIASLNRSDLEGPSEELHSCWLPYEGRSFDSII